MISFCLQHLERKYFIYLPQKSPICVNIRALLSEAAAIVLPLLWQLPLYIIILNSQLGKLGRNRLNCVAGQRWLSTVDSRRVVIRLQIGRQIEWMILEVSFSAIVATATAAAPDRDCFSAYFTQWRALAANLYKGEATAAANKAKRLIYGKMNRSSSWFVFTFVVGSSVELAWFHFRRPLVRLESSLFMVLISVLRMRPWKLLWLQLNWSI